MTQPANDARREWSAARRELAVHSTGQLAAAIATLQHGAGLRVVPTARPLKPAEIVDLLAWLRALHDLTDAAIVAAVRAGLDIYPHPTTHAQLAEGLGIDRRNVGRSSYFQRAKALDPERS